jgi:hypothetical protein
MITFLYKGNYIHENFTDNIIKVQTRDFRLFTVKSVHAAKCLIARINKGAI